MGWILNTAIGALWPEGKAQPPPVVRASQCRPQLSRQKDTSPPPAQVLTWAYFPRLLRTITSSRTLLPWWYLPSGKLSPPSPLPFIPSGGRLALGCSVKQAFLGRAFHGQWAEPAGLHGSDVAWSGSCHLRTLPHQKYHGEITYINMNIIKSSSWKIS